MITFYICSYGSSFEVTAQHQGFLGSNSIVNDAVVVGVQLITVVAQVILTGVTAVLRSSSESFHLHSPQKNYVSMLKLLTTACILTVVCRASETDLSVSPHICQC